jgi:LPXTG-site transpeptidase (sortase) family protein
MISFIKNLVETSVIVSSILSIMLLLVYFALNGPAVMSRWQYDNKKVELLIVEAKTVSFATPDNGMIWDEVNYDDIFLGTAMRKWYKEYADKQVDNTIYIPTLEVVAPIQYLDTTDEDVLQQKLKEGVGHYPNTAMPGEIGNVFMFGHSSYYWWENSPYGNIFANLEKINIGDKILVYFDQKLFIYEVRETKVVEATDLSVLEQGDGQNLTLMTCTPLGTNLKRFIASAELIN